MELELYASLVTTGPIGFVEDTIVNGHPVASDFGPGPMEATREFLATHREFRVDTRCQLFLLIQNPEGFLLRVR